jgi:hypothetical protein
MHAGADGGGSGGVKKVKTCKAVTPAEGAAAAAQPEQEATAAEMAAIDGESTGARMNGLHAEEPDVCLSCVVASPAGAWHAMLYLSYAVDAGQNTSTGVSRISLFWPIVALLACSAMFLQLPPRVGALLYVLVSV